MPLVKCPKCKVVVLDTLEDTKEKVQCHGCGRWYEMEIKGNQIEAMNEVTK